jgi:hypothetical protein
VETHRQGTTIFTLVLAIVGTIVVVQLWVLAAALDALFVRDEGVLVRATLGSLALFLVNAALVRFVLRFDARLRAARRD